MTLLFSLFKYCAKNKMLIAVFLIYLVTRLFVLYIYFQDSSEEGWVKDIYGIIAPDSFKLKNKLSLSAEQRLIGTSDSQKHISIAKNIVNYGLPFYYLDDLTHFIIQPGYGFFIALFFYFELSIKSILFAQLLLNFLSILMISNLVRKTIHLNIVSILTVMIITVHPSLLWLETNLWAESLYLFFITSYIYLYFHYINFILRTTAHFSKYKLLLMGLSIGLACIVRPIGTLFPVFLILLTGFVFLYFNIKPIKKLFTPLYFSLAGILIIMLPWSIYVYEKTNVIVWGSGGITSGKISNMITNENRYMQDAGLTDNKLVENKESAFKKFYNFLNNIPNRFLRLWLGINHNQAISNKNIILIIFTSILWIFAIIGVIYFIKNKNYLAIIFLFSFVLYVTFIHQIIHQRLRYSLPSLYFLISAASYGIYVIVTKFKFKKFS